MLVSDATGRILAASSRLESTVPRPASGLPPIADRAYFSRAGPHRHGVPQ
jgi:hypothetical protein